MREKKEANSYIATVLIWIVLFSMLSFLTVPQQNNDSVSSSCKPATTTRSPSGWSDDKLLSNASDIYDSEDPVIAANGSFVHIAYQDYWGTFPSTYTEIRYVRSTDYGETWSEPINISLTDGKYSWLPDIATTPDGDIYIVWCDLRSGSREIWVNISHDDGQTWEGEKNLTAYDGKLSDWPHVASEGDNVYVIWGDRRHGLYSATIGINGYISAYQKTLFQQFDGDIHIQIKEWNQQIIYEEKYDTPSSYLQLPPTRGNPSIHDEHINEEYNLDMYLMRQYTIEIIFESKIMVEPYTDPLFGYPLPCYAISQIWGYFNTIDITFNE